MSVRIAKSAGFCFGVSRAVELVEKAAQLSATDHVYTVMGAYACKASDYDSLPSGIYVLNGVKYIKK